MWFLIRTEHTMSIILAANASVTVIIYSSCAEINEEWLHLKGRVSTIKMYSGNGIVKYFKSNMKVFKVYILRVISCIIMNLLNFRYILYIR